MKHILRLAKTRIPNTISETDNPLVAELDGITFRMDSRPRMIDRNFALITGVDNGEKLTGSVFLIDGRPEWETAEIDCAFNFATVREWVGKLGNRPEWNFA